MPTIKPSEGVAHARKTVFVEGEIAGPKAHSTTLGGRWLVEIRDQGTNDSMATLVVNENPDENPAIRALGVTEPNPGVLQLFSESDFESLFKVGRTFRGEAIVGVVNGRAWFNVAQIILFEPEFKIGTRQVFSEPTCERRLLLQARGVKGIQTREEKQLGGFFVGNLVGSTFQEMVASERREELFNEFEINPKEFLLRSIQPEALLMGALGQVGESPRLDGNEWSTAKNQIIKLLKSSSVRQEVEESDQWETEVPVASSAIDGHIDLRTENTILEMKSGLHHSSQDDQVYVYLVGEMLRHGFAVKDKRKGVLVTSSTRVEESNRVTVLQREDKLLEILRRFLLARHRLLLTSSGERLPKIDYDTAFCESDRCPYYVQAGGLGSNACHFYCQTDRNWDCKGCKHTSTCTEHSNYHSFDVLDEANRIRKALRREIELQRDGDHTYSEWSNSFKIVQVGVRRLLTLSNLEEFSVDPPKPGEKVLIHSEGRVHPLSGQMCGLDDEGNWIIVNRGPSHLGGGETVKLSQPRSELNGMYHLQGCLDHLQRISSASSSREGISFAGGSIVSARPEIVNSLTSAISDPKVTDVFCQSFSVLRSKKILKEIVQSSDETLLIVTDAAMSPSNTCIDLRGEQLLNQVSGSRSITEALNRLKEVFEQKNIWVISPDMLLNTDVFHALPEEGRKYFDRILLYEVNNVSGLEYFLIRKYSKRMLVIGDGNCVGRRLHSEESIQLGLGDNLLTRVHNRGFPAIEGSLEPRIVHYEDQQIDHQLSQGLISCRLIRTPRTSEDSKIQLIPCELEEAPSRDELVHCCVREMPDMQRKELGLDMTSRYSPDEIEQDLNEFVNTNEIGIALVGGRSLFAPTSGHEYVTKTVPINPTDEGEGWVFKFYMQGRPNEGSDLEVSAVVAKAKELLDAGVKSKNLAIISVNRTQLSLIAQRLPKELHGVSLRTPYGITGESWGHVIVSCATSSAQDIDVRELYTIIRSSRDHVYIFGSRSLFKNHALMREMDVEKNQT